jgi:flagellar basal body L-ring protein FlgH
MPSGDFAQAQVSAPVPYNPPGAPLSSPPPHAPYFPMERTQGPPSHLESRELAHAQLADSQLVGDEMEPYRRAFGNFQRVAELPHYEEGSLWSETSDFNSPFDFERKTDFDLGDIIVVEFRENFQSRDDLRLENQTESEVTFNVSGLWNKELDRQIFGRIDGEIDYPNVGIEGNDDFQGESRGQQRSILTHTVACVVRKILPDGRLLIEGRDSRIIGRDRKIFLMSGVVDPDDVDPETSTVSSARVADSQFRWEGNGPGQNTMNPGIIHRILDYIPLF